MLNKIKDIFMFRQSSDEDDYSEEPNVNSGSIIWGILLRTAIIMVIIILLLENLNFRQYWWFMLFAIWIFAVYPGWSQWRKYHERIEKFSDETLCGSCTYFDKSSQLCKRYDQHVSKENIPCEGLDWEPIQPL